MATVLTSREFNQNASEAKKSSLNGPVIITDRGQPSHVLLSFADYKQLIEAKTARKTLVDLLAMPADAYGGFEFDPSKADLSVKIADLA